MQALADEAVRRLPEFSAQHIMNTASRCESESEDPSIRSTVWAHTESLSSSKYLD